MVEFADFNQEPREPRMMGLEVEAVTGAPKGWRSLLRTRAGRIELAITPHRDYS